MVTMEKGFYELDNYIYYGLYPLNQVSKKWKLSPIEPKYLKTDKPFSEEDFAASLYNNHALTEKEFGDLQHCLEIIKGTLHFAQMEETDFAPTEERLGVALPQEIKIVYQMMWQTDYFFSGSERFLLLEELYIENGNLVFYKIKRTPVAISLQEGTIISYYKKHWEYHFGDENFLCYALGRIVVKSILEMPISKKGRIKGELVRTSRPHKYLKNILAEKLTILEQYKNGGNIILFNQSGSLGWFRQNGFYADILVGCLDETLWNEIMSIDLSVTWA